MIFKRNCTDVHRIYSSHAKTLSYFQNLYDEIRRKVMRDALYDLFCKEISNTEPKSPARFGQVIRHKTAPVLRTRVLVGCPVYIVLLNLPNGFQSLDD